MKIARVQMRDPSDIHGIIAFVLTIFSQLLQFVVVRLQESLLDVGKDISLEVDSMTEINKHDCVLNSKSISGNDNPKSKGLNDFSKNISNKKDYKKNSEQNGNHANGKRIKVRDKSKNLLTKLRRPRNRKNSSDSDASDGGGIAAGSSSEEVNSEISETEEALSDDNALSDEISEDLSSDERISVKKKESHQNNITNGQSHVKEKIVEENENETDANNLTTKTMHLNLKEEIHTATLKNEYEDASANTLACIAQQEKQNWDPIEVLKVLQNQKMLSCIKICCDWLQGHQDIIRTCAKGSKLLLKRLIILLNLINVNGEKILKKWNKDSEIFSSPENMKRLIEVVPLPEDIDLKGLRIFENVHKNIDWELLRKKRITTSEETLLRTLKIVQFGHYLCTVQESGVKYNDLKNIFYQTYEDNPTTKENNTEVKTLHIDQSKGKLMRHMGKLWLKAEVHALENRLHNKLMSPYLVPDHEAFSRFMPLVKHLVYAKKFIVVIPSAVISALDEMKRTSSHAREATRWFEAQLQRGSRFLRAQRAHEKLPLPFMKGPKPKDKEAWLYFQIIECCHYLTQQSQSGDPDIPVVTLLTGMDDKRTFTFSPDGLAKSAGVNFEHIGAFHAKWKLSIKSHG